MKTSSGASFLFWQGFFCRRTASHSSWHSRRFQTPTLVFNVYEQYLLVPPCSLRMFQIVAGNEDHHPSCHENLAKNHDMILFQAHMDLLIGLTACSHEETNAGTCKEIHYTIL